ncbi:MAG: GTPase HflX [Dehalococcoidia bacterium]|nr:GTPase HflX [Dehalococcoidia bacterium]
MIPREQIVTRKAPERAVLVAVDTGKDQRWTSEVSIAELAELAKSAGAEIAGKVVQRLPNPHKVHYIGKGKLEELQALKETLKYDLVIVDDELTPLQQENLDETLQVKVIDRVALILDIFARRARTHEGQLQVELAQYEYLLPRLAGRWTHLERLGAGIGTRGPGESQLETDRRLIRRRIDKLKERLETVRKHRMLYREKRRRSGIPIVALVGYTNAGKSTLFNALSRSDVMAKDELFSTLDPTTRRLTLPDKNVVLITDTVGFIRKLPPTIVTAFRATLEELTEASLLVHVVDLTSSYAPEQCDTVEDILAKLNLADMPRITALNKIDVLLKSEQRWDEKKALDYVADRCEVTEPNTVVVSAVKKWGLNKLMEMISSLVPRAAGESV